MFCPTTCQLMTELPKNAVEIVKQTRDKQMLVVALKSRTDVRINDGQSHLMSKAAVETKIND